MCALRTQQRNKPIRVICGSKVNKQQGLNNEEKLPVSVELMKKQLRNKNERSSCK